MRLLVASTVVFLSALAGATLGFTGLQNTGVEHEEHAKFAVVVNGSNIGIEADRFDSRDDFSIVGENSNIIRKDAENLTWQQFLDRMPLGVQESEASDLCVEFSEREFCGKGGTLVNGQENSLGRQISQGDTFLLVVSTEGWKNISQDFESSSLPDRYKPFWLTGEEV